MKLELGGRGGALDAIYWPTYVKYITSSSDRLPHVLFLQILTRAFGVRCQEAHGIK